MFEPRTLDIKRATLELVMTNPPSKRAAEMEDQLLRIEELMSMYQDLAGNDRGEYLGVTVIIDLCGQIPQWSTRVSDRGD